MLKTEISNYITKLESKFLACCKTSKYALADIQNFKSYEFAVENLQN